jgi:hypothetical protein
MLLFIDFLTYYIDGTSSSGINWLDKFITVGSTLIGTGTGAYLGYRYARKLDTNKNINESKRRIKFLKYEQSNLIQKLKEYKPVYEKYVKECKSAQRISPFPMPGNIAILDRIATKLEIDKYYVSYIELYPNKEEKFTTFLEQVEQFRFEINNIISITEKAIMYQYKRDVAFKELSDKLISSIVDHSEEKPIFIERLANYHMDNPNALKLIRDINKTIIDARNTFFKSEDVQNKNYDKVTMQFRYNLLFNPIFKRIDDSNLNALTNVEFYKDLEQLIDVVNNQVHNTEFHFKKIELDLNVIIKKLDSSVL